MVAGHIFAENHVLGKVTIANNNLGTGAPTNLKYLARVVMDIQAKIHPDSQKNAMKHATFVPTRFLYTHHLHWPLPECEKASWPLNARTRGVVNVFNKNKEKSRASKLVTAQN